jgi:hypothetical protein
VSADRRAEIARDYLRVVQQTDVLYMAPSALLRECAESRRQLAAVLALLDGQADEAGQLAEIRELLAHFDWEWHDRQLALEAIERIVAGGAS